MFVIKQIWVIFNHLRLWIAVARHNLKWLEIQINSVGQGLNTENAIWQHLLSYSYMLWPTMYYI